MSKENEMNLKGFCLQELEAYLKFKSSDKIIAFKEWFYSNSTTFTNVDKRISEDLSNRHDCQVKDCYRNSWFACLYNHSLKYFEGFVASKDIPIPIQHAWIVNADGMVLDLTLIINGDKLKKQLKRKYGVVHNEQRKQRESRLGDEYFGVQIPTAYVTKMSLKHKITGEWVYRYFYDKIYHELAQVKEITN
jgi:hypothetical protein